MHPLRSMELSCSVCRTERCPSCPPPILENTGVKITLPIALSMIIVGYVLQSGIKSCAGICEKILSGEMRCDIHYDSWNISSQQAKPDR